MDWKSGSFSIVTSEGEKTVTGLVSDVFGIYDVGERREYWAVTHIPTGLKLTAGKGFLAVGLRYPGYLFPRFEWYGWRCAAARCITPLNEIALRYMGRRALAVLGGGCGSVEAEPGALFMPIDRQ